MAAYSFIAARTSHEPAAAYSCLLPGSRPHEAWNTLHWLCPANSQSIPSKRVFQHHSRRLLLQTQGHSFPFNLILLQPRHLGVRRHCSCSSSAMPLGSGSTRLTAEGPDRRACQQFLACKNLVYINANLSGHLIGT